MNDLKHIGLAEGIKSSAQVLKTQKRDHAITLLVSALGGIVGALSMVLMIIVMFEGSL